MAEIRTIQFKRGLKASLEAKLTSEALGVLLAGEPAFETDFGGLKIGDGIHDYIDLPYITGSSEDDRFVIQDPVADQVLLYDSTLGKWVNKNLADNESIIYLANRGLTLKGYNQASQGQMLVKDDVNGLAWIKPVSDALATITTQVTIANVTYDVLWKIAPSAATEDVYGIATSPSTGMLVRIHYFYETHSYDVEPYSPTGTDVDVDNEHRLVFTKTN